MPTKPFKRLNRAELIPLKVLIGPVAAFRWPVDADWPQFLFCVQNGLCLEEVLGTLFGRFSLLGRFLTRLNKDVTRLRRDCNEVKLHYNETKLLYNEANSS